MSRRLRIIVNPGDITDCNEETISNAVMNALIVQKSFFANRGYKAEKKVQVVVDINTGDPQISDAQTEFLKNLRQEGVIEECSVVEPDGRSWLLNLG